MCNLVCLTEDVHEVDVVVKVSEDADQQKGDASHLYRLCSPKAYA